MVLFNYTTMQVTAKIVYYGPGLGGKTTNLQYIHNKTAPKSRGEMVSLETEADRTLFFDLLPIDVGVIGGMKVRLQLYTVPGQVMHESTRRIVLQGSDAVAFVADRTPVVGPEAMAQAMEKTPAKSRFPRRAKPAATSMSPQSCMSVNSWAGGGQPMAS